MLLWDFCGRRPEENPKKTPKSSSALCNNCQNRSKPVTGIGDRIFFGTLVLLNGKNRCPGNRLAAAKILSRMPLVL
jgi:hypothetical protein